MTKVVHESPHKIASPPIPLGDTVPQADVQALAERVRQLEQEVALAKRQVPPAMDYPPIPAPPRVQYGVAPVQHGTDIAPPATYGCDPAWIGCGEGWWASGVYPVSVVVLRAPSFRRPFPFHGGHHFAMQRPVRPSGGLQRR